VEVDEIFRVTLEREKAHTTREKRAFSELEQTGAKSTAHSVGQDYIAQDRIEKSQAPKRAKSSGSSRKRSSNKAKEAKKFYLIDRRKRQLGPLSAKEIQSLYFRGIVSNSVRVVKSGSGRQVPVGQFVSVYAGARAQSIQDMTGHTQLAITKPAEGLPSSQVMDELAKLRYAVGISNFPSLASIFMVSLVIGALGYLLVSYLFLLPESPYRSAWPWHKDVAAVSQPSQSEQPPPRATQQPQPSKEAKGPAKATPKATRKAAMPRASMPQRAPVKRVAKTPMAPPMPKARPTPMAAMVPPMAPPVMPMAPPMPPRTAVMARAAPPPMPQVPQGPTVAGSVGQVATFAGMSFSLASLNQCDTKCDIAFSGPAGSLTVSFFKAAHGATLQRSGGTATITGRVVRQGNGYVMYLQSAR